MPAAPVAIITAASKGIGAACARLLAQRGYHLALFARGLELGNLATELDALAVTGDLTDSAAIEQLVHQTQQRYGRVDAVVNNTGHAAPVLHAKLQRQKRDGRALPFPNDFHQSKAFLATLYDET